MATKSSSAQVLSWLLLLFLAIGTITAIGTLFFADTSVDGAVNPDVVLKAGALPPDVVAKAVPVHVAFADPTGAEMVLSSLWRLLPIAIGWVAVFLLWKIARSASQGDPFVKANVVRLRILAGVLAISPLVLAIASGFRTELIQRSSIDPIASISVEISFAPLAAALLVLVLAEVFASGVRMREDVEGLV